jgi:hypothetical protein
MFQKLVQFFQGRHTLFLVACMSIGCVMSWFHKLDGNLVTLLLGLQGMVLAHSIKEDYFAGPKEGGQNG